MDNMNRTNTIREKFEKNSSIDTNTRLTCRGQLDRHEVVVIPCGGRFDVGGSYRDVREGGICLLGLIPYSSRE